MKRVVFAIGILALGFAASSPARADYAVVKFENGYCRIWWDASGTPWGRDWQKVAMAVDWTGAWAALANAVGTGVCR